jgi:hypothetical protein
MSNRKYKMEASAVPVAVYEISDLAKIKLINKFQRLEGSLGCYTSAYVRVCNQVVCLWRDECIETFQYGEGHEQNAS